MLDLSGYIQSLFLAAGGLALMIGVPAAASKVKGGLPLMFMALGALVFHLWYEGHFSF